MSGASLKVVGGAGEDSPAERMHALFRGAGTHHGTYDPAGAKTSEKGKIEIRETAATAKDGGATPDLWRLHLAGEQPLGVVPIREDGKSLWGAIDVDDYSVDHAALARAIERRGLPLVVCRSKSGGAHLYLFLTEPMAASALREALRAMAGLLGHPRAEVFPKQDAIDPASEKWGSWLNMPYHGGEQTDRPAVKATGLAMSVAEFLRVAEEGRIAPADLAAIAARTVEAPTATADPATAADARERLRLWAERVAEAAPGKANDKLSRAAFDLGRYCRDAALPEDEARAAIEQAWRARKADDPGGAELADVWRRQFRRGWERGRPAETWTAGLPVFERVQIERDGVEAAWIVQIEGQEVRMSSDDVLDQRKFNNRCLAQIDRAFPMAKHRNQWIALVSGAAATAEHAEPMAGTTLVEEFLELLENFVLNRHRGQSRDDLLLGKPFLDEELGRHLFRMIEFRKYLKHAESRLATETPRALGRRIRELGGDDTNLTIKGKRVSAFWVPDRHFVATPQCDLPPIAETPV